MKKLFVISMVVCCIIGCSAVQVKDDGPSVFDEIRALAMDEGAREINREGKVSGYIAYRKHNGNINCIGNMDNGGAFVSVMEKSGGNILTYVVGYYPNGEHKYILGIFLNARLAGREPLKKDRAESMARELLNEYKLGTPYQPNVVL